MLETTQLNITVQKCARRFNAEVELAAELRDQHVVRGDQQEILYYTQAYATTYEARREDGIDLRAKRGISSRTEKTRGRCGDWLAPPPSPRRAHSTAQHH